MHESTHTYTHNHTHRQQHNSFFLLLLVASFLSSTRSHWLFSSSRGQQAATEKLLTLLSSTLLPSSRPEIRARITTSAVQFQSTANGQSPATVPQPPIGTLRTGRGQRKKNSEKSSRGQFLLVSTTTRDYFLTSARDESTVRFDGRCDLLRACHSIGFRGLFMGGMNTVEHCVRRDRTLNHLGRNSDKINFNSMKILE